MNRATLIGGVAILLWSSLAALTAASGAMPPFQLATITLFIGGLCGLTVTLARGRAAHLIQSPLAWLVGVGGLFGYHAVYFAALRLAPPAEASLIGYLWPLLIVLMSALLPGERLRLRHLGGALLGFAAMATLLTGRLEGMALSGATTGYALALASAFIWAGYSILSRRLKNVSSDAVAGFCLATSALSFLCHLAVETTVWPTTPGEWLAVVGLGLGPLGLAFYVWDYGVKHGDIRLLGVLSYSTPILSTLMLVAGGMAKASLPLGIACVMIMLGAFIASR